MASTTNQVFGLAELRNAMTTPQATAAQEAAFQSMSASPYGGSLSDYIGPGLRGAETPGYASEQRTTFTVGDAFKDKHLLVVQSTINEAWAMLPQFLEDLLPGYQTDQMHIRMVRHTFDRTLPGVTADLVPSTLITTGRTEVNASTTNYSLAFIISLKFYKYAEGAACLATNLMNITASTMHGMHVERLNCIFNSPLYGPYAQAAMRFQKKRANSYVNIFSKEQLLTNCLGKEGGWDVAMEWGSKILERHVSPDTVLVPPGVLSTVTLADSSKTQFSSAGPDSKYYRQGGESIRMWDGKVVYVVPTYDISSMDIISENMSTRRRQIGKCFYVRDYNFGAPGYTTARCSTLIYNMNPQQGEFSPITLRNALEFSGLFGKDGTYHPKLHQLVSAINSNQIRVPAGVPSLIHPCIRRQANGKSVELIRHIGEMEAGHLTDAQLRSIAKSCSGYFGAVRGGVFNDGAVFGALMEGADLMRKLRTPSLTDPSKTGIVTAAAVSYAAAMGAGAGTAILPANAYGSINLPALDAGTGKLAGDAAALFRMGNFVYHTRQLSNATGADNNNIARKEALKLFLREIQLHLLRDADVQTALTTAKINPISTASTLALQNAETSAKAVLATVAGNPTGTTAAALTAFGGTITADRSGGADVFSVLVTGTPGGVPAAVKTAIGKSFEKWLTMNYTEEFAFPEGVSAYGFGTRAGMETLAAAADDTTYARFSQSELKKAESFISAAYDMLSGAERQFPNNPVYDERFTPFFQVSDDSMQRSSRSDKLSTLVHSLISTNSYPVFVPIVPEQNPLSGGGGAAAGTIPARDEVRDALFPAGRAAYSDVTTQLINALQTDPVSRQYLTSRDSANRLVTQYNTRARQFTSDSSFTDLETVLRTFVVPTNNAGVPVLAQDPNLVAGTTQSINLFRNLVLFANGSISPPNGVLNTSTLRYDWTAPVGGLPGTTGTAGVSDLGSSIPVGVPITNSRLSLDGSVFHNWASELLTMSDEVRSFEKFNQQFIRPANPDLPFLPLAFQRTDTLNTMRSQIKDIASARAHFGPGVVHTISDLPIALHADVAEQLRRSAANRTTPDKNAYKDMMRLGSQMRFNPNDPIGSRFASIEKSAMPYAQKVFAKFYIMQTMNKTTIDSFLDNNIPLPFEFLCCRNHTEYLMASMVICQRGEVLGHLIYGQQSMMGGTDTTRGLLGARYDVSYTALLLGPERMVTLPDVLSMVYIGGEGSRFVDPDEYNPSTPNMCGDIFSFLVPLGSTSGQAGLSELNCSGQIDIRGAHPRQFFVDHVEDKSGLDSYHYSTFLYYNLLYRFDSMTVRNYRDLSGRAGSRHSAAQNTLCFPEFQYVPDENGKMRDNSFLPEKGLLGKYYGQNRKANLEVPRLSLFPVDDLVTYGQPMHAVTD